MSPRTLKNSSKQNSESEDSILWYLVIFDLEDDYGVIKEKDIIFQDKNDLSKCLVKELSHRHPAKIIDKGSKEYCLTEAKKYRLRIEIMSSDSNEESIPQTSAQTIPQTSTQTVPQTSTQTIPQTSTQNLTSTTQQNHIETGINNNNLLNIINQLQEKIDSIDRNRRPPEIVIIH